MRKKWAFKLAFILFGFGLVWVGDLSAHTANKVWMEFRANGRFRVWVNYTIPELKTRRESYVEFSRKQDAEAFFFDLVRGADFYEGAASERKFVNQEPLTPVPW